MTAMDTLGYVLGAMVVVPGSVLGIDKARQELQVWAARRRLVVNEAGPVDLGEGRTRLLEALADPEALRAGEGRVP